MGILLCLLDRCLRRLYRRYRRREVEIEGNELPPLPETPAGAQALRELEEHIRNDTELALQSAIKLSELVVSPTGSEQVVGVLRSRQGNAGGVDDECCICLSGQEEGPLVLVCGEHVVHVTCGLEWAGVCRHRESQDGDDNAQKPTCPVCRTPFSESNLIIRTGPSAEITAILARRSEL